jgi:O-methyltransferase
MLKRLMQPFIPEDIRIAIAARRTGITFREEKSRRRSRERYAQMNVRERADFFWKMSNFCFINRPIGDYYMEFGCCGAMTFRLAWDHFHHLFPTMKFIGFDSFEGFPDIQHIDKQEIWQKGKSKIEEEAFRTLVLQHGIAEDHFQTVKGFYEESLTKELQQSLLPKKAGLIYVDCDLYHSTVPVLRFIEPFLQHGTLIAFDEWNAFWGDPLKGEQKAFREFQEQNASAWRFIPIIDSHIRKAFVCLSQNT